MTTNKTTELLPCPCCGASDVRSSKFDTEEGRPNMCDFVICNGCGLAVSRADADDEPTEVWNRRAALPPPVAEPVAWAIFAPDGNVRIWFGDIEAAKRWKAGYEPTLSSELTPLYATPAPDSAEDAWYNELIFAVGRKHAGETRHDTALRYIRQAEQMSDTAAMQTTTGSGE